MTSTTDLKSDAEKRLEVAAKILETASAQLRTLIKEVEHALAASKGITPPETHHV